MFTRFTTAHVVELCNLILVTQKSMVCPKTAGQKQDSNIAQHGMAPIDRPSCTGILRFDPFVSTVPLRMQL